MGNHVDIHNSPIRGQGGGESVGNHVDITLFPMHRPGWWGISGESCRYTQLPHREWNN